MEFFVYLRHETPGQVPVSRDKPDESVRKILIL